jgi:hypothetical protein
VIHEVAHTRAVCAETQRVGAIVTGTVAGEFLGEEIGGLAFVALLHMGRKGQEGKDRIGDIADPLSVIYMIQVMIQHHLKSVCSMLCVNNESFFVLDKPDRHRVISLHRYIGVTYHYALCVSWNTSEIPQPTHPLYSIIIT